MKSIVIITVAILFIAFIFLYAIGFLLKHIQAIIFFLVIGLIIYYLPWWVWVILIAIILMFGSGGKNVEKKPPPPPPPPPKEDNVENRTPEEILGLKYPWTSEDLKAAYKREAGRTHPDKWINKPEVIRKAMEEEFKMIQEAYRQLGG